MKRPRQYRNVLHRRAAAYSLLGALVTLSLVAPTAGRETPPLDALLEDMGLIKSNGDASAPEFSLSDVSGNTIRLADLKGKVVFLTFWGTW